VRQSRQSHQVDERFLALPSRALADAALSRARELGAAHADFRLERHATSALSLRDARLETSVDGESAGFSVRVVADGSWGFASGVDLTPEAAVRVAEQAVELARVSAPVNTEPVELADEPSYGDRTWCRRTTSTPSPSPTRTGSPCWPAGAGACSTPTAWTTWTRRCSPSASASSTPTSPVRRRRSNASGSSRV
jgi:hypothetical protein